MAKFKPGDRVRTKYQLSVRYPKGYEDVVTALKSQHGINFVSLGDDPGGWLEEHFELVQSAKPEPVADECGPDPCSCPTGDCPTHQRAQSEGPHGCMDCGAVVCTGDDIRCVYCAHRDESIIDAGTTSLDERIAAVKAELSRPAQPRFPSVGRDCRVYGRNRR